MLATVPITVLGCTGHAWNTPLAMLRLVGPARSAGINLLQPPPWGPVPDEMISAADLILIQREFPVEAGVYQQVMTKARAAGKPVIFEMDDLLLDLPESHPDRDHYAPMLPAMRQALVEADAVITTTELLASYLRQFNTRVWVVPNYLDDTLWTLQPPKRLDSNTSVVVGYMGGDSHSPDLENVAPILERLLVKYHNRMVLRFFGAVPPPTLSTHPAVTWTPSGVPNYIRMAEDFAKQGYMVAIAPLSDNLFNQCKSAIKFLEYTAIGAAGVFSNLTPYATAVDHGKNGFLAATADEWELYLSYLIENPDLRYQMALAAQETVRRDWLLSQNAERWAITYREILAAGNNRPGEATSSVHSPLGSASPESLSE